MQRSNEIIVSRKQIKHVLRARSRKRENGSLIFRKRSGKKVPICPCHQIDKAITKYIKRLDREHTWAYDYCPTGATYLDLVWSPPDWSFSLFKLEFVALQIKFLQAWKYFVKPMKIFYHYREKLFSSPWKILTKSTIDNKIKIFILVIDSPYGAIDCAVCWCHNIMPTFAMDYEGRLHPQRNIQDLP